MSSILAPDKERERLTKIARKKNSFKIERKGKWRISGDRASILPKLNSEGLTLKDVNALAADMRRLYDV